MTGAPEHLAYAEDVLAGRIAASRAVIAQCRRTLAEHERGFVEETEYGEVRRYEWRAEAVAGRLRFFGHCQHPKGRWRADGEAIRLEPWQLFFVSEVYGWIDIDNPRSRRIREAILLVGRKNGKTTVCAPLGLHEAGWGDEGAEVYVVATKAEQAAILWKAAKHMIEASPVLAKRFTVTGAEIKSPRGTMTPLSSKSVSQDGFNPSLLLVDEAAAVTDANQIHVIESGMGSRDAPLSLQLSTAQPIRNTLFHARCDIARRGLLDGSIAVSSFALLYELDDIAEVEDPDCWIKANPNLGVSVTRRDIGEAIRKSAENPRERGLTLCKRFNIWAQHETAWLPIEEWDGCAGEPAREGPAYIGLDLAENLDLAAACVLWDNGGGRISADWKFWTPRVSLDRYPPDDRHVLEAAAEAGILELLEQPFVDTDIVREWVCEIYELEDVRRIGTDPWHAKKLTAELEELGLPVLQVGQSAAMLSDPIKTVESAVVSRRFIHPGYGLLSWMVMNVIAVAGMRGGVTLAKPITEPHRKIDGLDALVTAAACLDFSAGAFVISDLDLEGGEDEDEFDDADLLFA